MLSSVSGPMSCESVFSPSHTGKWCQIKLKKKNQFVEVGKLKEALRSENDSLRMVLRKRNARVKIWVNRKSNDFRNKKGTNIYM